MLVPLSDADERCGGKAAALGRLLRAGFAVPDGVVVLDPGGGDAWAGALADELPSLGVGPFAVRSSARGEDGAAASFAGQLATSLDVATPAAVVREVRRVSASGSRRGVAAYAARTGHRLHPVVPVIVQRQVAAEVAGVLFTRHPVTGADEVVVEAAAGLGTGVVGGTVTPHRWTVRGDAVGGDDPLLTTSQVRDLARTGRRAAALLGGPQDVEWAVADGAVWLLQSRPVTTGGDTLPGEPPVAAGGTAAVGIAAGPGRAAGPARVVAGLDDFACFRPGDVLVCRTTSPAWTPVLTIAAAVVTETGGLLAHAAIVARELGIPAVLGVDGATSLLRDGQHVVVDGTRGTVSTVSTGQPRAGDR